MKAAKRHGGLAALVCAGLGIAGIVAPIAGAALPRVSVGAVPRLPAASHVTGSVSPRRRLALTVTLQSRDPLGMQRLAEEVSTPGSPQFHDYLTVGQFADRFGAGPAQIAAVSNALRADGLQVSAVQANHLTLAVTGTAGQVQQAFETRLAAVRLADGTRAYAERATPTLPAALAPDVESVVGLSTLAQMGSGVVPDTRRPHAAAVPAPRAVTGGPQACATVTGIAARYQAYTAEQIQQAYGFSGLYAAGATGQRQSIAVYELEKVRQSDVAAYQRCYRTHVKLSYVDIGHPQYGSDDGESALDIEQLIGLAPSAHLIVYQAQDTAAGGLGEFAKIMSQDRARTVSVSWGGCERKLTADGTDFSLVRAEDKLFQEAALQGQSILSAAGDTGSAGCSKDLNSGALAVQDPSSQPFATAVGGTTLFTPVGDQVEAWNPGDTLDEAVWNDGIRTLPGVGKVPEGTGGGISALWAMPSYQRSAAASVGVRNADSSGRPCRSSGLCREVPDVSANADPNLGYIIYASGDGDRGWTIVGGTSAAAPVWAALTADADSSASCRGASLGFENPSLYDLAAAQPGDLREITLPNPISGLANNDATKTNHGLYPVTAGYNMTTGLGVPNALALTVGMCGLRAPVYSVSVVAPHAHPAVVGARFRLVVEGIDSGRLRLRFGARGLPRGLTISRSGVITGRPLRVGRYTVTVTATDHATNHGALRFVLPVLTPPARLSRVGLAGVARGHASLGFTAAHGDHGPDLRAITVHLPAGLALGSRSRAIAVAGRMRYSVIRIAGGVTIRFRRPQPSVRVTLQLVAAPALVAAARHHSRTRVSVTVVTTDRRGRATQRGYGLRLH